MKAKVIKQGFDKGFSRGSKIMAHLLGLNTTILLNEMVSWHNYNIMEGEFMDFNGKKGFYYTHTKMQIDTSLGKGVIKRSIKKLEAFGLIEIKGAGTPRKNYYILNQAAIQEFESKHMEEYEAKCAKINNAAGKDKERFDQYYESDKLGSKEENDPSALIIPKIGQNDPTSESKLIQLDGSKWTVSNNNINNKNIITTNLTSEGEEDSLIDEELTELISSFIYDNDDQGMVHERVFLFLKSLVPGLSNFHESTYDAILIDRISEYSLNPNVIAFKILKNAKAIEQGKKRIRFGDLFVGLEEMNTNKELMFGT